MGAEDAGASGAVRTILGLVVLLGLAWAGAHPRVRALEERLGISQVVTSGFPFFALGLVARIPAVGVLTPELLRELNPLFELGLGWLGFLIGFRFDVRSLDRLPPGTHLVLGALTGLPVLVVILFCGPALLFFGHALYETDFLRDAAILGAAAAATSSSATRFVREQGADERDVEAMGWSVELDYVVILVVLTLVGAYFRAPEPAVSWLLPGTGWLFVTLGLGLTAGTLVYAIMRRPATSAETTVILLGSIAFSAGLASHLHLSPLVVCFVAGAVAGNFPGAAKERYESTLELLRRPIYLLFLLVAGASWDVGDWRGLVLLPLFLSGRFLGRAVGLRALGRLAPAPRQSAASFVVFAPMGALSIAIVVGFQAQYLGRAVPWIVTAVIGSAVLTEVIVQLLARSRRRTAPEATS